MRRPFENIFIEIEFFLTITRLFKETPREIEAISRIARIFIYFFTENEAFLK
jgi:hypothetical protein